MRVLYWLTVFGNLSVAFTVFFVVSAIATGISIFAYLVILSEDYVAKAENFCLKILKRGLITMVASTIALVFLPSKSELYMIYGIGSTIDYIKKNPTAKQLPDKCIKALDKWADNLAKEEPKKEVRNE